LESLSQDVGAEINLGQEDAGLELIPMLIFVGWSKPVSGHQAGTNRLPQEVTLGPGENSLFTKRVDH